MEIFGNFISIVISSIPGIGVFHDRPGQTKSPATSFFFFSTFGEKNKNTMLRRPTQAQKRGRSRSPWAGPLIPLFRSHRARGRLGTAPSTTSNARLMVRALSLWTAVLDLGVGTDLTTTVTSRSVRAILRLEASLPGSLGTGEKYHTFVQDKGVGPEHAEEADPGAADQSSCSSTGRTGNERACQTFIPRARQCGHAPVLL